MPAGRTNYFYVQSILNCQTNNFATDDNGGVFYTFVTGANISGDGVPDAWKIQYGLDPTQKHAVTGHFKTGHLWALANQPGNIHNFKNQS